MLLRLALAMVMGGWVLPPPSWGGLGVGGMTDARYPPDHQGRGAVAAPWPRDPDQSVFGKTGAVQTRARLTGAVGEA